VDSEAVAGEAGVAEADQMEIWTEEEEVPQTVNTGRESSDDEDDDDGKDMDSQSRRRLGNRKAASRHRNRVTSLLKTFAEVIQQLTDMVLALQQGVTVQQETLTTISALQNEVRVLLEESRLRTGGKLTDLRDYVTKFYTTTF
jgi:hypothetical protein